MYSVYKNFKPGRIRVVECSDEPEPAVHWEGFEAQHAYDKYFVDKMVRHNNQSRDLPIYFPTTLFRHVLRHLIWMHGNEKLPTKQLISKLITLCEGNISGELENDST